MNPNEDFMNITVEVGDEGDSITAYSFVGTIILLLIGMSIPLARGCDAASSGKEQRIAEYREMERVERQQLADARLARLKVNLANRKPSSVRHDESWHKENERLRADYAAGQKRKPDKDDEIRAVVEEELDWVGVEF